MDDVNHDDDDDDMGDQYDVVNVIEEDDGNYNMDNARNRELLCQLEEFNNIAEEIIRRPILEPGAPDQIIRGNGAHANELAAIARGGNREDDGSDDDDGDDAENDAQARILEELRQKHELLCEEGDGWSHAFDVTYKMVTLDDGSEVKQIASISNDNRRDMIPMIRECYTLEHWERMGQAIRESKVLSVLTLINCGLSSESMTALFSGEDFACTTSLKGFWLKGGPMGPECLGILLPFLKSLQDLQFLDLGNSNIGNEWAIEVADLLNISNIKYLCLQRNTIGDEGVQALLASEKSNQLIRLNLSENEIGTAGVGAISQFLARDNGVLTELRANCPDMASAKKVIDSISPQKSKIETLSFWDRVPEDLTIHDRARLLFSLEKLISNPRSFETLCESNHHLSSLGPACNKKLFRGIVGRNMWFQLHTNARSMSKVKIMRAKLRELYFQKKRFDVNCFSHLSAKLMPRVLELVTRKEDVARYNKKVLGSGDYFETNSNDLNSVFRMVRNCQIPEIFSFTSPELRVQQLETENCALEEENASLKERIELLMRENESLRHGTFTMPPVKRTKPGNE